MFAVVLTFQIGGQARSPYNLTVNPGGSSSGSAVAVAANLCMFALGTETDGSGQSYLKFLLKNRDLGSR